VTLEQAHGEDARGSETSPELSLQWALRPLYGLYERRLLRQIAGSAVPRHVGLILDGNRREARRWGITDPIAIYRTGADRLDAVLNWCSELAIPAVTLWVCSTDNLGRASDEVAGILGAIEAKMMRLADDPWIHHRRVRVSAIGCLKLLPHSTLEAIRVAETATSKYEGLRLTIAVAYGGRQEITDAVRSLLLERAEQGVTLAAAAESLTPEAIGRHLYLAGLPDPELIIRTSGEIRMSGFLLWQSAYSEFYFCDINWPAFRKVDFLRAVRSFQERKRRYGL
jgi:short-chain Z-isoprenyl diphosphate synthase